MLRGLIVPLSPREEISLRRIAQGSRDVPDGQLKRLVELGLVRRDHSGWRLTDAGQERASGLPNSPMRIRRSFA